jgi:enoyl-CoA hydratase/carnithine racemase
VGSVATEIRGFVAVVSFDNAARMNAIDAGVAEGLAAAAAALKARGDIGAMVLRGAGEKSFCSGIDLKFVEQFTDRAAGFAALDESIEAFCRDMVAMPFPTVAMLHGNCHGGGVHLAATADFRFGDAALKLSVPAVKNKLFYPISALERLVLIIGETRTKRMLYEGGPLDAETLLGWGFLDRVCPGAELERATLAYAAGLAGQPREVVAVYQEIFRALRQGDTARARELRVQAKAKTAKAQSS